MIDQDSIVYYQTRLFRQLGLGTDADANYYHVGREQPLAQVSNDALNPTRATTPRQPAPRPSLQSVMLATLQMFAVIVLEF